MSSVSFPDDAPIMDEEGENALSPPRLTSLLVLEDTRGRVTSVPVQRTELAPPALQPTAIFYVDDPETPNGHIVVDKGLGPVNELRNVASSVSSESQADFGSVERTIQWDLNYQEAAIFLEEGANNDKFDTHPRDQASLPAYSIVHNRLFYILELVVALLLMSLAFIEEPSVDNIRVPTLVHALLEILCLGIISVESVLKIRWMSPRVFVKHKRSMLKMVVLAVMVLEALVVAGRARNHFRITRALRPIFLVDCRYARGVRRFVRQILFSLPPIVEMYFLLLFFTFIFAILGNQLFPSDDANFSTLNRSFISLFVLFTTANYPDVMMKDYDENPFSFLYFLMYLVIELYFIMNLLLAVVCNSFTENEMKKLKGLLLHRREACRRAFRLLNSRSYPDRLSVKHFVGLMRYFSPRKSILHVYLSFKVLNKSETGLLTLDEFFNVYEASELNWKLVRDDSGPWFCRVSNVVVAECGRRVNAFVRWRGFKYLVFVVLFANALSKAFSGPEYVAEMATRRYIEHGFLAFYILEAALKIFGLGPSKYFKSAWNSFDFALTVIACIGFVGEQILSYTEKKNHVMVIVFQAILVLRPLRLLRLFKYRKRYRDVFATVYVLLPRMSSVGMVMVLLYYFYAIIGMEIFATEANRKLLTDCCINTTVEGNYKNNTGFYYLNNFDNILRSMVTLFELTVVNNWFIIMDGFAHVMGEWTRVFFMTFYLITMVVVNIVIAFILEAFTFRIDYRKTTTKDMDEDALVKVSMLLTKEENLMVNKTEQSYINWQEAFKRVKSVDRPPPPLADGLHGGLISRRYVSASNSSSTALDSLSVEVSESGGTKYRGVRSRRKVDFSMNMYAEQVQQWYKESDAVSNSRRDDESNGEGSLATAEATVSTPIEATSNTVGEIARQSSQDEVFSR